MDLFSRPAISSDDDQVIISLGIIPSASVPITRGLYLALIIGIMMILAIGSILAVQLRPYTAPPAKLLGGDNDQPRLVDAGCSVEHSIILGEGGEYHGQVA